MRYQANPVQVEAQIIVGVGPILMDGSMNLALQNGQSVNANKGMIARYTPQEGDYWVQQSDGYLYVNPKEVFERKYSIIPAEPWWLVNGPIPKAFTPNPDFENPILHRDWKIFRWTGWKGHMGRHFHSDGICPSISLPELCHCSVCGEVLGQNATTWASQSDDREKHWKCAGDPGTVVGQWLAFKGAEYKAGTKMYASYPGWQGIYEPGGCFDIRICEGQKELTYDTSQEELLAVREECLIRLKLVIDAFEDKTV